MKRLLPVIVLFAACGAQPSPPEAGPDPIVIVSETSFGMCLGYCLSELAIDSGEARLTYRSHGPDPRPPVTHTIDITPAEWRQLLDVTDRQIFQGLDSIYGCPDCADGGAEVVELEWDGASKRVVFEYGNPPQPIQALRERIWQLRGRFPDRPGQ